MMKDHMKFYPQFWTGKTGKATRQFGRDTQLVAIYLFSNPHANMLGIYYLPEILIAHETGVPLEITQKALQNLHQIGFCSIDTELEYVWVHEMAFYQIVKPNDRQIKELKTLYDSLPDLPFLKDFHHKYEDRLFLEERIEVKEVKVSRRSEALKDWKDWVTR